MAHLETEEFQIIFLDKKNGLLADEVQGRGTVTILRSIPRSRPPGAGAERQRRHSRAQASLGRPDPSTADISMTQNIASLTKPLGISVHDHIIIGRNGHASLRAMKLL